LEERVDALGFEFVDPNDPYSTHTNKYNMETFGDRVALQPKGDCLPNYSRDAHIWRGSLEELQHWLNGVEWARAYDGILKISNHKKRSKAEADERNRQLMATIKKSKLVQGTHKGVDDYETVEQEVPF
jgi:hypothetical protein